MTLNETHRKALTKAGASFGLHADLYVKEANDLRAAGLIETRITFTKAGGSPALRHFITEKGKGR